MTVKEIFEFLRYLKAPECIIEKAPSAGLFDGQTDESEMGLSYAKLDEYLLTGKTDPDSQTLIEKMHSRRLHKPEGIKTYASILTSRASTAGAFLSVNFFNNLSAYASRQKAACELHQRHGVEVHEIGLPLGIDLPKAPKVSEVCVVDECVYGYALLKRAIVDLNCCVWLRKVIRQHPHTAAVLRSSLSFKLQSLFSLRAISTRS